MANTEKVGIQITGNLDDVEKQLQNIDKLLKSLNSAKVSIAINQSEITDATKNLETIQTYIKDLSSSKAILEIDQKDIADAEKGITDLTNALKDISKSKAQVEVDQKQVADASKSVNDLSDDIKNINKGEVEIDPGNISEIQNVINDIKDELSTLNKQKTTINVSHNLDQVGSAISSVGDKLLGILNPLKSGIGQLTASLSIFSLLEKGISAVVGSLDTAIGRFDTLQNYPKVLTALGFSSKQATDSINALSAGVDGLPTKLDSIVAINKQITSVTGNIEKSTQTTIALNNAFLASGASEDEAARGAQQFIKILTAGEVNLVSWQSLIQTMPVSLTKVANALGYTGTTALDDLYNGLKKGKIPLSDFQDALIELGTGTGELAELAKINSEGIATSFSNLKYAVARNVANVLTELDKLSQKTTGKTIAQNLDALKGVINSFFAIVIANVDRLEPIIYKIQDAFAKFQEKLAEFDKGKFLEGFKEGINELVGSFSNLKGSLQPIIDYVKTLITNLGEGSFEKGLGKLPALLIKVGVAAKVLGAAIKGLSKTGLLNQLFGGKKSGKQGLSFTFDFGQALTQIKNIALIYGSLKIVQEVVKTLAMVNEEIPTNFTGLAKKFLNLGVLFAAIETFVLATGKIVGKDTKSALAGVAFIAALSVDLILVAEALNQINKKVPSNITDLSLKIANIAIAVSAIGAIASILGLISKGIGITGLAAGIASIAAIGLELLLLAEALKQIDEKVPDDLKSIGLKIANIAIAVTAIGALAGVIGAIAATGIGGLALLAGIAGITAIALEIMLLAEAIKQLEEKVPSDVSGVKQKIYDMTEIIAIFTASNLGSSLAVFSNLFGAINTGIIIGIVRQFQTLAEELNEFAKIKIADNVGENIERINEVLDMFNGATFSDVLNSAVETWDVSIITSTVRKFINLSELLNELANTTFDYAAVKQIITETQAIIALFNGATFADVLDHAVQSWDTSIITGTINKFIIVADTLDELTNHTFDYSSVKQMITEIQAILSLFGDRNIGNLINDYFEGIDIGVLNKSISIYVDIAQELDRLANVSIDVKAAKKRVEDITEIISLLTGSSLGDLIGSSFEKSQLNKIIDSVQTIHDIALILEELGKVDVNLIKTSTVISKVQAVIEQINGDGGLFGKLWDMWKSGIDSGSFSEASKSLELVLDIANTLTHIGNINFDYDAVYDVINNVKHAIEEIGDGTLSTLIGSAIKSSELNNVVDSFERIYELAESIKKIADVNVNTEEAREKIRDIARTIQIIGGASLIQWFEAALKPSQVQNVTKTIGNLMETIEAINLIASENVRSDEAIEVINEIYAVISELSKLSEFDSVDYFNTIVASVKALVVELNALFTEFIETGRGYGENLVAGYESANVNTEILKKIEELIKNLKKKEKDFKEIGKKYGTSLKTGFGTAIANLHELVNTQITLMSQKSQSLRNIGVIYGNNLVSGFGSAISTLASQINAQISQIQDSLDNIKPPVLNLNLGENDGVLYRKDGGSVDYYAKGGSVFKPKGSDTIPAMLSPGEYVHRSAAVSKFGTDFMDRINRLDVKGAYQSLSKMAGKDAGMISNIKNIYNNHVINNNQSVHQNINGGNQNYTQQRAKTFISARA